MPTSRKEHAMNTAKQVMATMNNKVWPISVSTRAKCPLPLLASLTSRVVLPTMVLSPTDLITMRPACRLTVEPEKQSSPIVLETAKDSPVIAD